MAKFYGIIGFASPTEIRPGVWDDSIREIHYPGDIIKHSQRWQNGSGVNDDINISLQISIIADNFAMESSHCIKYAEYMGTKWKVTTIEPQFPRLLLTLGGVYNGEQT